MNKGALSRREQRGWNEARDKLARRQSRRDLSRDGVKPCVANRRSVTTKGELNMKRLVAFALTAALTVGLMPTAFAAPKDVPLPEKEAVLQELEIMEGDGTGALHLERNITRAEFTKLLVSASPYKGSVGDAATDPYPDVSHRDWFAPYVRAAVDAGLVKGDLEGYFRPARSITLAEGVTMAVRLLGYRDSDFASAWPTGQLALYRSLDLDEGVAAAGKDDLMTRGDCLHLFYNLLTAPTKQGGTYGSSLGCPVNAKGEVDVPTLFRVEQEGPVAVTGNWQSRLPFDVNTALVYRNNDRATLADLREWDLVYWAKEDAILFASEGSQGSMGQMAGAVDGPVVAESGWQSKLPFALGDAISILRNGKDADADDIQALDVIYWGKYDNKLYVYGKSVTGTVEAVSPALAAPTAVTVAGQTYVLETFEAQYAFSDMGTFRKGDRVRLLLGRGGGVAAVRALDPETDSGRVGIVSALETKTYLDAADRPYSAKVITLTGADGLSYSYPYSWSKADAFDPGEVVRVTSSAGSTTVARVSSSPVSGTVDASATHIGTYSLSPDAEILDTYGDYTFRAVPASRLAGVRLTQDMVRYAQVEKDGTVTALILNDVTGDLHSYGVMTDVNVLSVPSMALPNGQSTAMTLQGVYTYDLGGRSQVLPVSGKRYSVKEGPFCLMTDGQEVKSMKNLTKLDKVTLEGSFALQGSSRYPLADNVAYYLYDRSNDAYTLSTRSLVLASESALEGWYDKPPAEGGQVRVILARAD